MGDERAFEVHRCDSAGSVCWESSAGSRARGRYITARDDGERYGGEFRRVALKTGRADEVAIVRIDSERCIGCGLCAKVCKGAPLRFDRGRIVIDQSHLFGCIGCGQCVAVCPEHCIEVEGRDLFPSDVIEIPPPGSRASYEQLKSLMMGRRSVRDFQDREVEAEMIEKIVDAASTAPIGLPPSDVEILILNGRERVREFAHDVIDLMQSQRWVFSPLMRLVLRPFIGKEACESFRTFVRPVMDMFIRKRKEGEDWLLYGAPLAMYFHTSPYADPFDPIIVATYAMLAAEALGLGSCMIGTPAPFLKHGKGLKRKYDIPIRNQQGIVVIFGYAEVKYRRAIKRRLAQVRFRKSAPDQPLPEVGRR